MADFTTMDDALLDAWDRGFERMLDQLKLEDAATAASPWARGAVAERSACAAIVSDKNGVANTDQG